MGEDLHTGVIPGDEFEEGLLKIVPAIFGAFHQIKAKPPILTFITLRGDFKYKSLSYSSTALNQEKMDLKEEVLLLPPREPPVRRPVCCSSIQWQ